jgi:hypothetical protein
MNYNRKLAKWRLTRQFKYVLEVDKIMAEYATRTILDGGSEEFKAASRKQLINLQNDIKSKEKLLEFLQEVK